MMRIEPCATLDEIVLASRILAQNGILDSFGHVSARHPDHPDRYLISRVRAPALVEASDIHVFDLDSVPMADTGQRAFIERVIHGCIYRARTDVMAACHHHSPAMLPFCITDVALRPVFHLGATMGAVVPVWDSQAEFGDTNLLVGSNTQGKSLSSALGSHWTVLLRGHGVTTAGRSVKELVFRTIYGQANARAQRVAMAMGAPRFLSDGEIAAAAEINLSPIAVDRAWENWCRALDLRTDYATKYA